MTYDSTVDVKAHRALVFRLLDKFSDVLIFRGRRHDLSKLEMPEKATFDTFVPMLKTLEFGSPEYRAALEQMGAGLKHHYEANDHHPEHYPGGVEDMDLAALAEMFFDWCAAAAGKGADVDLDILAARFGLSPQLVAIFRNTLERLVQKWNI